ncbi:MAG: signal recognition particle-docking protein FtsY [Arenimonas sp.]|nr:signal recognition particle-docking protein FtsY [Arenimonas sp.]
MFDLFKRKPKPDATKTPADTLPTEAEAERLSVATNLDNGHITQSIESNVSELAIEAQAINELPIHEIQEQALQAPSVSIEANEHAAVLAASESQSPEAVIEHPVALEEPTSNSAQAVKETVSKSFFARTFGGLFSRNPKLDPELLDELETTLISADVGVNVSSEIMTQIRKRFKAREFGNTQQLLNALRQQLYDILAPVHQPLVIDKNAKPFVLLTVGINGAGKTTSIGKLARRFQNEGHSLMLAAGDTFRAAAVQQIQIWGERNNVAVLSQGQDADPASVAFDALQAAKARGYDVLIVDTAGRLHTQTHLMAELSKVKRVLSKIDANAPHEVLLIIDGTTGQNAINQCRAFKEAVGVTGLIVTKLDGSAKGGVLFALAREFGIPIRFIGLGEKPDDLRPFDPKTYVDALLPQTL